MKKTIAMCVFAWLMAAAVSIAGDVYALKVFNEKLFALNATNYSDVVTLDQDKKESGTYTVEWHIHGTNDPVLNGIQVQQSVSGEQWYTNTAVLAGSAQCRTNSGQNSDGRGMVEVTPAGSKYLRVVANVTNGWGYLTTWILAK